MGKKRNHVTRKRTDKKDRGGKALEQLQQTVIVNLHRRLYKVQFKKKAPQAIKEIKSMAQKMMFTTDVRVDTEVNKEIWRHGIRNLDRRIKVTFDRKKNEDDEATDSMYTIVRLAK